MQSCPPRDGADAAKHLLGPAEVPLSSGASPRCKIKATVRRGLSQLKLCVGPITIHIFIPLYNAQHNLSH